MIISMEDLNDNFKNKTIKEIEKEPKETKSQTFWEIVRFVALALVIVIPIRVFIAQPFIVSGSSMFPTFENGEYLIVDEISYRLENPKRNDVIIFRYPNDPSKFFIKRIIGLPNEKIDIRGNEITITNEEHKSGFKIDQPYIKNHANNNIHFETKEGEYFVMGDNRTASSDSRYWGAVPRKLLIGKAFLRLLPINKIDIMPGFYKQTEL